ncbi:hypothetical protein DFS34DRAFT_668766 [Phlyctochytrium arcticum]|nr:hypothetical protein DFS34DRAFT_668766 [Phlyctochytrium arcticum]
MYKNIAQRVRPAAVPLPQDAEEQLKNAATEPPLRDPAKIGHSFTPLTLDKLLIGGENFLLAPEKEKFREMIVRNSKAFSFDISEIGCVDPKVVQPMVIFTVPHVPWNLRPIPVPKALLRKLIDLLKDRMKMKVLEFSTAPHSNRWVTVTKKSLFL